MNESQYIKSLRLANSAISRQQKRITELEESRRDLIEEFAEAECMGDLAKIARNHGYDYEL